MLLNEDIVDIKKPDGICSLTFVEDKISGLFFHPPWTALFVDLKKSFYK